MRKISSSVVNIDIHPHDKKGVYGEFILSLCRRKIHYRADRSLILRGFEHGEGLRSGEIITFLDIDPEQPWFDPEAVEKADDKATEVAKQAVARIKPSMQVFRVTLVEDDSIHCLVVETKNEEGYSLSAGSVAETLRRLSASVLDDDASIAVEFSVLSSNDQVERLLAKKDIKRLYIVVVMPNANDGKEEDDAVKRELAKRRATRKEVILSGPVPAAGGIQADEELRSLARVASRHGRVEVTYGTRGSSRVESTSDKPVVESEAPRERETYSTAFKSMVNRFIVRMKKD